MCSLRKLRLTGRRHLLRISSFLQHFLGIFHPLCLFLSRSLKRVTKPNNRGSPVFSFFLSLPLLRNSDPKRAKYFERAEKKKKEMETQVAQIHRKNRKHSKLQKRKFSLLNATVCPTFRAVFSLLTKEKRKLKPMGGKIADFHSFHAC